MKHAVVAAVAGLGLLSAGCLLVPRHHGHGVVVAPLIRPGIHVHGASCGHFWGYYGTYPVYYEGGRYTYWNGGTWIFLATPPGHRAGHRHQHHGSPPPPAIHGAVPP